MQNSEESAIGIMLSSLEMMEGVNIHEEYYKILDKKSNLTSNQRDEVACRKQLYEYYSDKSIIATGSERCKTCMFKMNLETIKQRKVIPTQKRLCTCGICSEFVMRRVDR